MELVLLYFSLKYQGYWPKIYQALERKEKVDSSLLKQITMTVSTSFLTIIDKNYPKNLKALSHPPFVLYYQGNLALLQNYHQIIGLNGDQDYNNYGAQNCQNLVNNLIKENRTLLIEEEPGLNQFCQDLILNQHGKLILVLKKGLKNFLENNILTSFSTPENFLIISESYQTEHLKTYHQEASQRLQAGLAKAFVFIQIKDNETTKTFINHVLEAGKNVFVFPEPTGSIFKGNNRWLKNGATLIENSNDLLNDL